MTQTIGGARALVVDDEPAVARAVRRCLERVGFEVVVAASGAEALDAAAASQPRLIVMDLGLPDMDGRHLIRQLRTWIDAPIIVLTGTVDEATLVETLRAGADDYVTKPYGPAELQARAEAAVRRASTGASSPTLTFGAVSVDLAARQLQVDHEPVRLTRTEWSLLEAFVTNPGKLLAHWWLLDRVWGQGVGAEGRQYLRVYAGQLRAKLGDSASTPRYIQTEPGVGYRWIGALERDSPA